MPTARVAPRPKITEIRQREIAIGEVIELTARWSDPLGELRATWTAKQVIDGPFGSGFRPAA
jgi:hypothetical protein